MDLLLSELEVVVDGLPLFRGAQQAIDTTMVSPVRSDAEHLWTKPGGGRSGARLVVLGCEVGGRWSDESRQFLTGLAAAKAMNEPEIMRKSTMFYWLGDGVLSWRAAAKRVFIVFAGWHHSHVC